MTVGLVIESYNAPAHVGLLNQGATCYLNSLLQCLYNDNAFRQAIFNANTQSSKIIDEIQKLFAKMQLSGASAVSTQDLSAAFGWDRSQIFEQHDVHELLSVLVDALGSTSQDLQQKLNGLFQGSIKDVLCCPECGHKSSNPSSFLALSLDLPDTLESVDLEEGGVLSSSPGILLSGA
jgi:ubiquitin C-terminal hydrolase